MKAYNQGAFFRVTCSESDIEAFAAHFPCSGFRYGDRASFTFDTRNGDLVDLQVVHAFAGAVDRDGPGLLALSQDAHAYGMKRLFGKGAIRMTTLALAL
jgi:hypothetical protein